MPSPEWKKRVKGESWYPGDTVITGIGQGFTLVTPLQLATAVAAIAKRGQHFRPHVLLRSEASNGTVTVEKPEALPPITLSDDDWDVVKRGCKR